MTRSGATGRLSGSSSAPTLGLEAAVAVVAGVVVFTLVVLTVGRLDFWGVLTVVGDAEAPFEGVELVFTVEEETLTLADDVLALAFVVDDGVDGVFVSGWVVDAPVKVRLSIEFLFFVSGILTWTFVINASSRFRESSMLLNAALSPAASWDLLFTAFIVAFVTASLFIFAICCCDLGDVSSLLLSCCDGSI